MKTGLLGILISTISVLLVSVIGCSAGQNTPPQNQTVTVTQTSIPTFTVTTLTQTRAAPKDDYSSSILVILKNFDDSAWSGTNDMKRGTALLADGALNSGYSLIWEVARTQISSTDSTIQLLSKLNPPSKFIESHNQLNNILTKYRESYNQIGYYSSNKNLKGLISAMQPMGGNLDEFDTLYKGIQFLTNN